MVDRNLRYLSPMKAVITTIKSTGATANGDHYLAQIQVDGMEKSFAFTVLDGQRGDMAWDTSFDQEFLRYHVDLGIQVMDLVRSVHEGRTVDLPREFSD